ncbi:MAG: aminotransferase class IV, partial [Haliea sp.]
ADENLHLEVLRRLVTLDARWVPATRGSSLYIRPAMIASSPKLGLGASAECLHFIITSPVGSYFNPGFEPIAVLVSESKRRAVRGGVGEAETGGTYAAILSMIETPSHSGYNQILWLDAIHGHYVEQAGATNICFVYNGKLSITPALSGSILAGITRDPVLELAGARLRCNRNRDRHHAGAGRYRQRRHHGGVRMRLGCGNRAGWPTWLSWRRHVINDERAGPVASALQDALTGIQYGARRDQRAWTLTLEVE